LTNGTAYTFTAAATNTGGTSSASTASGSVTPLLAPPGAPPAPSAVTGNGQATVTVTAGSGGTPASYVVTAAPGGATCTVTGASGSCVVTGLTNGIAYTFTATATNEAGTSEASATSNAVTPTTNPAPAPSTAGVTINAGPVKGTGRNKRVNLSGTTRKPSAKVSIYRANKNGGKATLVATTKSKSGSWSKKKVSLGGRNNAYFCARVGANFSTTIRVPSPTTASLTILATAARGDMLYCPKI